jgi:hypothetical protein
MNSFRPSISNGVALGGMRKAEIRGAISPVAKDITPKLLKALASIFVCSLCTRFDMFLSIQKATIFQVAFLPDLVDPPSLPRLKRNIIANDLGCGPSILDLRHCFARIAEPLLKLGPAIGRLDLLTIPLRELIKNRLVELDRI